MRDVYMLRCRDNAIYIGETDDLTLRLERHNEGRGCAFTATRQKKEALIAGDRSSLKRLSRSRSR